MDLGEELRDRGGGFGARDAIEMADLVERPNLLLKGSGRVNRILGPEEDLTDILGKSLRQARRQREQSCRVRLARLHLEKIRVWDGISQPGGGKMNQQQPGWLRKLVGRR